MPYLRVQIPGQPTKVYNLYKKITTLGSGADCDLVLPDPVVADSFAHILFDGRDYQLATLGRRDEITVNGKKRKKHRLAHQDRVSVGGVDMTFSMFDERPLAEGSAPEPKDDLEAYRKIYEFSARLIQHYDLADLLNALMDLVIEITSAHKGFLILMEGGR